MTYTYKKDVQDWLHFIRYEEMISVLEFLPGPSIKILEIGGGDGYIASLLSNNGYVITSTDIAPRYPSSFPVREMCADHLKFPNQSFDVIFSSNVLEHIKELTPVFKELKRVANKEAIFIFVLPTPAWRLISSFWYIFRIIKTIFSKLFNQFVSEELTNNKKNDSDDKISAETKKIFLFKKIKQIILHPHGEYPSFIHELYYFSPFRWKRFFRKNGFKIIYQKRAPLFYSGEHIFKFRFIKIRKLLAKYLFSSGHIYVLKFNK